MFTFTEINDKTGFANGDVFHSEAQIREYFTVKTMTEMFNVPLSELPTQAELNEMAELVWRNDWHVETSE